MPPIDPGPPPARGVVVRALDDGFYARLNPAPAFKPGMALLVVIGFALAGLTISVVMGVPVEARMPIIGGSILFGGLLYALSAGSAFFPAEVRGDGHSLSWAGERFAWDQIGSCVAEGDRLELRGLDDRVLASLEHLEPAAARWVADAVMASLQGEE